ncbi:MAG: hypothetical protein KGH72_00295 [Candidatus Micrarchaeota archaeon]|nr:hypothetical protein [Candidatus Micrarchaeota archaeon]
MDLSLVPVLLQAGPVNQTAYVAIGATYTENTIAVLLTLLTILAVSIQIARGYFLRILRKFTLRLAADIWWLLFVILRDASIFLIVFLGFELFYPGIYEDFPIAVPFELLAVNVFAAALVLLLLKDTDEEPIYNTIITVLVVIGAGLYIMGTVFVTESAVVLTNPVPATVSTSTSNIWGYFNQNFDSQNNPTLAMYSFYICFTILLIEGGIAILYGLTGGNMPRGMIPKIAKPIVKQPMAPGPPPSQQDKL